MKNLARVLSLVLVLTMMVSSVAFAGTFTDIEAGSAYADATAVLSGLGIINGYDDGTFGPEKVITRAEVTAIVNRLQGLSDAAKAAGGTTAYTDVAADEWYAGDVNLATQMGIIEGDGNGLFRPEDPVKYEEAVKMMVAACGYDKSYVLSRGGWPTGYLVLASESGITKGLTATAGAPAYRGIVAKLAYQALTAPMMGLSFISNGVPSYEPKEDEILLEKKLGFIKLSGYVVANSVSFIEGTSKAEEGKVVFKLTADKIGKADADYLKGDAKPLYAGKSGVEATLGLDADIFVKEVEGKKEIVAYALQPAKSNVVAVENAADIQKFGDGPNDSKWNGSKYFSVYDADADVKKTYSLNENATVILNGTNVGKLSDEKVRNKYIANFDYDTEKIVSDADCNLGRVFAPTNGTVELVDRGTDGDYDQVNVTSYETTILVDDPYSNNTKIPTFAGTIDLDFENVKNASYTITLDGEAIEVADLKKNDVISVAKTDEHHWDIKVSRATVSGQIAEMDPDEGIYVIDGKNYIAANLFDAADANLGGVSAGDEGVFFLDVFGNIALYDATVSATKDYGFIVAAEMVDDGFGEKGYEVRILDKDGAVNVYRLADEVRYGEAGTDINSVDADDVFTSIDALGLYVAKGDERVKAWTFETGKTYYDAKVAGNVVTDLAGNYASRMITFKANSQNEIVAMTTAKNSDTDTKNFALYGTKTNLVYNAKHSAFNKSVGVTEDTIVFNLPIDAGIDWKDFAVETIASLEDTEDYNVSIFSVNEDNNAGMLVITNLPSNKTAPDQHLAVALKQMVTSNADGDSVYSITFLQNGEEKTLTTTTDCNYVDLKKGDLFEYSVNAAGEIDLIAFANANGALKVNGIKDNNLVNEYGAYDDDAKDAQYVFGVVYGRNASARLLNLRAYNDTYTNVDVASDTYRHIIPENANIVVIDCLKGYTASDRVVAGAFGDIQVTKIDRDGNIPKNSDYAVLIKYYKDDVVDVIVYKNFVNKR